MACSGHLPSPSPPKREGCRCRRSGPAARAGRPAGAAIPDSDTLQADACGPAYKYDSNTRLQLESKAEMRKRDVASPDEWDAVALTFAEPVAPASFRRRIEYPNLGIV